MRLNIVGLTTLLYYSYTCSYNSYIYTHTRVRIIRYILLYTRKRSKSKKRSIKCPAVQAPIRSVSKIDRFLITEKNRQNDHLLHRRRWYKARVVYAFRFLLRSLAPFHVIDCSRDKIFFSFFWRFFFFYWKKIIFAIRGEIAKSG